MKANKKGVSEIVSYVFLIVITISLSLLVFAWLKNYIIQPEKNCPDGVSLIVSDYNCSGTLVLNLRNKGLFDIDGFILRYSNNSKPPSILLSDRGGDYFYYGKHGLKPNENYSFSYKYSGVITRIDLLPIKYVDNKTLVCTSARFGLQLENCN